MKILVTGGTGSVGRALVNRLSRQGHAVLVIGRSPGVDVPGADYEVCDVSDYDRLARLMHGCDAVIHLAAIPWPGAASGREVFRVNAAATFTLYEAAAANGIHRVVTASSINALGYHFGRKLFPIKYLPVDEGHPWFATDAYSFAKQVMEQTAEYFWHREGISGASIRLPKTLDFEAKDHSSWYDSIKTHRAFVEGLLQLDEPSRRARIEHLDRQFERLGRDGFHETRGFDTSGYLSAEEVDFMVKKTDFWAWIDARDSAQVFEKCVTADYDGAHVLFANAARNEVQLPHDSLALLYLPRPELRAAGFAPEQQAGAPDAGGASSVQGGRGRSPRLANGAATGATSALVSIERARELVGFTPEYNSFEESLA